MPQKDKDRIQKNKVKSPSVSMLKATADDIHTYLRDAISMNYVFEDGYVYGIDYCKDFVYFCVEYYDQGYYSITYKLAYNLDGVNVSLNGDLIPVKKETIYTEINPKETELVQDDEVFEEDGNIFRGIESLFKKYFKKADKDIKVSNNIPVIKQFQDEQMISIEPMYCPPETEDGHGEQMTLEVIKQMVQSANDAIEKGTLSGGLFHSENRSDIEILEAWVNPCECIIGETEVQEGQPIVKVQFHNTELWDMRKSGELGGLSIGCKGSTVTN